MSESRITIPEENINLAGADENVQQPNNDNVGGQTQSNPLQTSILDGEKERRLLFRWAFGITLTIILVLYSALLFWLYSQTMNYHIHNNVWHIALILAIPPTTLLFLLIKVLAKQENSSAQNTPAEELVSQLVALAKSFFDKK